MTVFSFKFLIFFLKSQTITYAQRSNNWYNFKLVANDIREFNIIADDQIGAKPEDLSEKDNEGFESRDVGLTSK